MVTSRIDAGKDLQLDLVRERANGVDDFRLASPLSEALALRGVARSAGHGGFTSTWNSEQGPFVAAARGASLQLEAETGIANVEGYAAVYAAGGLPADDRRKLSARSPYLQHLGLNTPPYDL